MLFRFSFFLFFCSAVATSRAAQSDSVVVRSLSEAWLSVDEKGNISQSFADPTGVAAGFFILSEELEHSVLRFCGKDYAIWLDGRLIRESDGCGFTDLNDLAFHQSDTLFFMVLADELATVSVDLIEIRSSSEELYSPPIRRGGIDYFSTWTSGFILTLILFVLLKQSNYRKYSDLVSLKFLRWGNEQEGESFSAFTVIALFLLSSLIVINQWLDGSILTLGNALSTLFIAVVIFVTKIVIITAGSQLFGFRKMGGFQFSSYLFFSVVMMMVIYCLQWLLIWNSAGFTQGYDGLSSLIIVASILYLIWLYFILANRFSVRKLHLISYLCATEILPTFILANWLFD